MANSLSYNQINTILAEIAAQATGAKAADLLATGDFTSIANTVLPVGYDALTKSISMVLSRTLFSNRPYTRKFQGLEASAEQYGAITRKLYLVDKPFEADQRYTLEDGVSVDQQKVNKPIPVQLNFYGFEVFQRSVTMFKDQLDAAFKSPEEFGQFVTMVMQNASDIIEQAHEGLARGTITNLIGGVLHAGGDEQKVHLLTRYNAKTGLALTAQDVYKPENFKAFIQWMYAEIAAISAMMTERTEMFHFNLTGKAVKRHTPYENQRIYLFSQARYNSEMMALADIYHDNYLRMAYTETVNFWQSSKNPAKINVTASYLDVTDGTVKKDATVEQDNVMGVIFDRDAAGYTTVSEWSESAPFNAAGGYQNTFYHWTDRYWNDFTENAVVLLLD
nr:MAG TPA: major capsid protein [Caudoviricetes sp.]